MPKATKTKPTNRRAAVNHEKRKQGQPTKYRATYPLAMVNFYQDAYKQIEDQGTGTLKEKLIYPPSVARFARHLGVSVQVLYVWREKHAAFDAAMHECNNLAAEMLSLLSLNGVWNASMASFLLKANHGFQDKTTVDISTGDGAIRVVLDDIAKGSA